MADAMLSKSEKATFKRPTTSKMDSKVKGKEEAAIIISFSTFIWRLVLHFNILDNLLSRFNIVVIIIDIDQIPTFRNVLILAWDLLD
jgi:hypothetical protein